MAHVILLEGMQAEKAEMEVIEREAVPSRWLGELFISLERTMKAQIQKSLHSHFGE